jgi:hypothetical protein
VVAPIIRQNKGWAVFAYTPIGGADNIGAKLYTMASMNPAWFCQRLTVDDTDGVFTAEDLAEERAAGMDEDRIGQEYYCRFTGSQPGAYYAKELQIARAEGRLGRFPYDPKYAVETAWDLGTKDATAIWFYQQIGRRVHLIDYFEGSGSNLIELNALVHGKRYGYRPGYAHTAPHDVRKTEFSSGKNPYEIARELSPPLFFRVIPKMNPLERITAARVLLPRCYFDEVVCLPGLAALSQYHKEWDEETRSFALKPAHDWSSHGADAFGHLAVGLQDPEPERYQTQSVTSFDPSSSGCRMYRQGIRIPESLTREPQPTGGWDPAGGRLRRTRRYGGVIRLEIATHPCVCRPRGPHSSVTRRPVPVRQGSGPGWVEECRKVQGAVAAETFGGRLASAGGRPWAAAAAPDGGAALPRSLVPPSKLAARRTTMPLSKYFRGHGAVMKDSRRSTGKGRGKRIATRRRTRKRREAQTGGEVRWVDPATRPVSRR